MENSKLKKPQRNSALELLRIIAMLMIVFHHFSVHGKFAYSYDTITLPRLWYYLMVMGGKIGVDVFVLISGYFLINDKNEGLNFKRISKLWGQAAFYSIAITAVFALTGKAEVTAVTAAKSFFPVMFRAWWFLSAYFVIYLLHPYINKLLTALSKKQFQTLLVIVIIMWCLIPSFTTSEFEGSDLVWFAVLYTVAAYIRLYGFNPKFKTVHYTIFFFVFAFLTYFATISLAFIGTKTEAFRKYITFFYGQEKLPTLLTAVSLFMIFASLKMSYHKWINIIASATFGVYLIHDSNLIRPYLWRELIVSTRFQNSLKTIPFSVVSVVVVFIVCAVIDLIRQFTFEKLFVKFIDRFTGTLTKPFEMLIDFSKRIVFGKGDE